MYVALDSLLPTVKSELITRPLCNVMIFYLPTKSGLSTTQSKRAPKKGTHPAH